MTALMELYLQDDDNLLTITREGLSVGISTIITNSQTSGVGYRYLANFANKIALYCNDNVEYSSLFERTSLKPDNVAGRCITEIDKRILECQTYMAFGGTREIERVQQIHMFVKEVNERNKNLFAKKIPSIPSVLTTEVLEKDYSAKAQNYRIPVGLTYSDVSPFYLDISTLGIIGLCGKENTGHENFVNLLLNSLESSSKERAVRLAVFDDFTRKFSYLKEKPNVETYSIDVEQVADVINEWHSLLTKRYDCLIEHGTLGDDEDLLLMIVQNNDVAKKINDDFDLTNKFNDMTSKFRGMNVAIIFANYSNASLAYDAPEPLRIIKRDQHIILFDDLDALKVFEVPYEDLRANRKRLETGDAYYILDNEVTKIKIVKAES